MLEKETEKITTRYLSDNQRFSNGTPSNYIIFKRKPGLGATYGEITYEERNSIILEPNTPVLEGKRDAMRNGEKLHPNILVVFKGVEKEEVLAYLKSDITPKKILCTPEAYMYKVRPSIESSDFNLYSDFFMLLDECDRLIKDVHFRDKITLPMGDFFKFKSKAMISATAIEPTDQRFLLNNFKILNLEPELEIRQKLILIQTNNIIESIDKARIRNEGKQMFVFINSPTVALMLIKRMDIEGESRIYTSIKSVRSLKKEHGFDQCTSSGGNYSKYNFMTSRYYSAVDIELNDKPVVIMISDVIRRKFTMLDPYTDVIQILGRFRNGIHSAAHITNFKADMEWKEEETAVKFIKDSFNIYEKVKVVTEENNSTEGGLVTGKEALEGMKISNYIDSESGGLSSFMLDNFILDHRTISYYTDIERLKIAYEKTNYFTILLLNEYYDINDSAMLVLESESHSQESNRIIAEILQNYTIERVMSLLNNSSGSIWRQADTIETMQKEYPEIVESFDTIGFEKMEALKFDTKKMLNAVTMWKKNNELNNPDMILEIHKLYKEGDSPLRKEATTALQVVYTQYGIRKRASGTEFENYFRVKLGNEKEKKENKQKVYTILGLKYPKSK